MGQYEYPDLRYYEQDKEILQKYIDQRAKNGIADCDTWNFDNYLILIIIKGLRQLAKTTHGYPGRAPYNTFEEWQDYLFDLADRFAVGYIYYYEPETIEKDAEIQAVLRNGGREILQDCFTELGKNIFDMWD